MKLVCPCCGATLSIEALLMDGDARAAVQAALSLPPQLGALVLRYIALFRPAKRALSWDRAAKILTELQTHIDSRQVQRNGITYAAPLELWQAALDDMLARRDKLQTPLKSHGYLFEVIAGMANKAGAKVEAKKEHALRTRGRDGVEKTEPQRMDKALAAQRLSELKQRMGDGQHE